jgi:streptomycin 6-kinase
LDDVARDLPQTVQRKAMLQGEAGRAWLAGLEDRLDDLARAWNLSLGATLPGGTEALVVEVVAGDGGAAVLKLPVPGIDRAAGEVATLLAAQGRGYAALLRHDRASGALLLERLGPTLDSLGLPARRQIAIVCDTLLEAWTAPPDAHAFMTGVDKALSLRRGIEARWQALEPSGAERAVDLALRFVAALGAASADAEAVLAHGDPHPWNTLIAPGRGPRRFKFVDPDGLVIERAYDLGVLMREWCGALLAGDPLALGRARCRWLARRTGVAPEPIWRWGLAERVSTGLLLLELGLEREGAAMLAVADAWTRDG